MKAYFMGAAALLLGTSALAAPWTSKSDPAPAGWNDKPAAASTNEGFGPVIDKQAIPADKAAAYAPYEPYDAYAMGGGGYQDDPAMTDPVDTTAPIADPIPPAEPLDPVDPALAGDPAGTGAPVDTIDSTTSLGETSAPMQTADASMATDLTPRPATQNYPACEPGPGDDNCIQLYEPGVRTALASWTGSTGGLMDESTAMASADPASMPADSAMATASADQTAYPDSAPVETAMTDMSDPAMTGATPAYEGVGGPVAETDYPPCSGSPSDDRCIQLYERGVTGEGN